MNVKYGHPVYIMYIIIYFKYDMRDVKKRKTRSAKMPYITVYARPAPFFRIHF